MSVELIERIVTLWVVIDPIGTVPVFIAVTAGMPGRARRKTALVATLVSAGVLLFFLVFGQLLIDVLGIGLLSFQVAGGIVLFLFALTMIFGEAKQETDKRVVEADAQLSVYERPSPAVFPLAVPSLASPGAMLAVVLLTDNNYFSVGDQSITAAVMIGILGIAYVFMLLAGPIIRLIGNSGAAIVSRVMGMILASVAADAVLSALLEIFKTGTL
ncbi:MAG: MarC family protein [Pseudomonadota bacterium]